MAYTDAWQKNEHSKVFGKAAIKGVEMPSIPALLTCLKPVTKSERSNNFWAAKMSKRR